MGEGADDIDMGEKSIRCSLKRHPPTFRAFFIYSNRF